MLWLALCGQCKTLRINDVQFSQNLQLRPYYMHIKLFWNFLKSTCIWAKSCKFSKSYFYCFFLPGLIEAHNLKIRNQVANYHTTTNVYIETIKIGSGVEARQRPKGRHVSTHISFERFPSPQGRIKQTLQQKLQVYKLLCTSSLNSKILPQEGLSSNS